MYVSLCACVCQCMYLYVGCIYIYICTYIYSVTITMHVYICKFMQMVPVCVGAYMCMYMYACKCMYARTYARMHVCIYIQENILTARVSICVCCVSFLNFPLKMSQTVPRKSQKIFMSQMSLCVSLGDVPELSDRNLVDSEVGEASPVPCHMKGQVPIDFLIFERTSKDVKK